MKTLVIGALVVLVAGIIASAQSPTPPPPACTAAEFRQFDFWLGKWNVRKPDGAIIGASEITRESEGCAIRENWTSGNGKHGMSINYYDAATKRWHQDWVGGDGTILHLQGGIENGAMVLSDHANENSVSNRITWTTLSSKELKQEWAMSKDAGKTWETGFVGIYERL